ncbi:MAG TPA: DUF305 domain-containing protein [Pseudonocardiaceae bacterium]
MRTTAIRDTAAAVLLSAAVLGLAGCVNAEQSAPAGAGNGQSFGPAVTTTSAPPVSSAAGTQHNAADVTFIDQSVQLRQQAVTIANLAARGSTNTQIHSLATDIAGGTGPSVTTMTGWLSQWNEPAPQSVAGSVPGVLAAADLQQLQSLTGTPFDMHWLQDVRGNLTAAQQLAGTEASKGSNSQAKALAQQWTAQLKTQLAQLATITG